MKRVLDVTDDAAAFLVKPVIEETLVTQDRIFSHYVVSRGPRFCDCYYLWLLHVNVSKKLISPG